MKQQTAIVIGAGAGGIATAARLTRAGFKVTVMEKNSFTGGRCSLIYENGYRFDQGPSLLLLPRLFNLTFEELGTSLEAEGIDLRKCEPNYRVWFDDGHQFELSTDLAAMKKEIARWEGQDGVDRYYRFLSESHLHYEVSVDHVLLKNFYSLLSILRPSFLRYIAILHPFESMWRRASLYFYTERLRRVFTFGSMYMGMSPFDAPGTYSLLQYTELAEGIWYPVGGFHRVLQALVEVGKRMGVEYRMNTNVEKIVLGDHGVRGVQVGGKLIEADVIVNNSDLVYAYNNLMPPTTYSTSLSNRPASCSSISFYWALDRQVPELDTHNIFLAKDYKESFDSIFKKHLIPDEPSFYVNVPSRVDASAAPEGKDTIVVLVPVGHMTDKNGANQDWPRMISMARTTVISTIKSRMGIDLGPLIVHEETNDPETWKQKFNLDKGAILGLSHSFFNVLSFRPRTKARRPGWIDGKFGTELPGRVVEQFADLFRGQAKYINGLYMVGASVYPGTGVPIVMAGGRLVAEQVLQDYHMPIPWARKRDVWRESNLDRTENPWMGWSEMVMMAVLAIVVGMYFFLM